MQIKKTGIEQYMPGGESNLKVLVIGGPGVGKTRWSSYWPEPIYLNCEDGLASISDREMPYVDIKSSEDMLKALRWLKNHPDAKQFGTVVLDTADSYQKRVKDEWLLQNPRASSFSGYDAWGYLDAKMQATMTRLLSLPMNVLVLVHFKEKNITRTDPAGNKTEESVFKLQIQGDIGDTIYNEFDLVGLMDTFWVPGEEGGKVEARGITFKRTPDRPFLKDRLHITPSLLPVKFEERDYTRLLEPFMKRLDELKDGGVVGEVEDVPDDRPNVPGAVPPSRGGALPPQDPREMPLEQLKKPELIQLGKDQYGLDLKPAMLKDELITEIQKAREAQKAEADAAPATESTDSTPVEADASPEPEAEEPEKGAEEEQKGTKELIEEELGGELVSEEPAPDEQEPEPEPEPEEEEPEEEPAPEPAPKAEQPKADPSNPLADKHCENCEKNLADENRDWVRLGWIRLRKMLCNDCYQELK